MNGRQKNLKILDRPLPKPLRCRLEVWSTGRFCDKITVQCIERFGRQNAFLHSLVLPFFNHSRSPQAQKSPGPGVGRSNRP
jgi:hypothetical protein